MSIVLGIETTCDETAASVVKGGREILSNIIHSQTEHHLQFGGVYPELASRKHIDLLIPAIDEALIQAGVTRHEIDLIAVASKPGLMGALLMGVGAAKALAYAWKKPFVGVNHIEAHLYAAMMGQKNLSLPALGVVISGGHTSLVKIQAVGEYELLGGTVDDAIGEAFDKVGRMLGLPYPGGPQIERLAKDGDPSKFAFTSPQVKGKPLSFSFSGLKTQVLYTIKERQLEDQEKKDIAAAFQEAALRAVISRCLLAAESLGLRTVFVGGGVSNNKRLRELFPPHLQVFYPPPGLSLDNAAMIAGLGYHIYQKKGESDPLDLIPSPTNKTLFF